MADGSISSKDPYAAPNFWLRLLVYIGLNSIAGVICIGFSPGGSVQTFGTWIQQVAFMPIYAPAFAAFIVGGLLQSPVLFIISIVICYVISLVLTCVYFSTESMEKWYLYCAILVGQLVAAVIGSTVMIGNLRGWT